MNITVKKPVYRKQQTPTGVESMHTFELESDWTLSSAAQSPAEALSSALAKETEALQLFLTEFLRLTVQYFAKPYSVAAIIKTLKHVADPSTATGSMTFQPREVQISSRGFLIQWICKQEEESTLISLPDMDDEAIEDIDEIPSAATNEVIQLQSPNIRHIYDRQRVKEANLRAKLAQYKANRAHLEYLEKYGEAPSDSSDSEPDDSDESE